MAYHGVKKINLWKNDVDRTYHCPATSKSVNGDKNTPALPPSRINRKYGRRNQQYRAKHQRDIRGIWNSWKRSRTQKGRNPWHTVYLINTTKITTRIPSLFLLSPQDEFVSDPTNYCIANPKIVNEAKNTPPHFPPSPLHRNDGRRDQQYTAKHQRGIRGIWNSWEHSRTRE